MKIRLDREQRDTIFPANIVLDNDLRVIALGPAIRGRFPEITQGASILDHFRLTASTNGTTIQELSGTATLLNLESHRSHQVLSGWVIPYQAGYLLALRLAPTNYSLEESGLQITDFAVGDPAVHALLMFSIQRALLKEQRLVALELDRARQLSQDLSERISRSAGFLAHDFNNFISIIKLNCDRLKMVLTGQERPLRLVDVISGAASRGSAITRSLMALSNQRADSPIPVDIDALILENQAFLASAVGIHVNLQVDLGATGGKVMVSPVAALNCLVNLLINARDAMPRGGQVKLATRRVAAAEVEEGEPDGPAHILIEVTDTGVGMTAEVSGRAFEPFFSTKPKGNGLGLASVLEFAVEAGGKTSIASTPGAGTSILLSLPCINPTGATVERFGGHAPEGDQTVEVVPPSSDAGPQILVVEDEPFALEALCELLGASGFEVTGVGNSSDALDALRRSSFKVLLSDIVLADESGANLAREACALHPSLKVILMSGFVPRGEELDDRWLFLRKPIDAQVVTEVLRAATRA